jgi:hypothetical protein
MAAAESQSLSTYLPVLVQVAAGPLDPTAIILIASHVFGQRAKGNYIKGQGLRVRPADGRRQAPPPLRREVLRDGDADLILFDIEVGLPGALGRLVYREFLAAGIAITAATAVFLRRARPRLPAYEFKARRAGVGEVRPGDCHDLDQIIRAGSGNMPAYDLFSS